MKRENRVRKHSDFDRIIQQGESIKGTHFSLFYERNAESKTQIGIAVGKKNGGAVARVKIKRQIRAMIARHWSDWSLPLRIVIIVRPSYRIEEFTGNQEELESLLRKIKGANLEP